MVNLENLVLAPEESQRQVANNLSSYCLGFGPVHDEGQRIVLKIWKIGVESVKPPSKPSLYLRRPGSLPGVAPETTALASGVQDRQAKRMGRNGPSPCKLVVQALACGKARS